MTFVTSVSLDTMAQTVSSVPSVVPSPLKSVMTLRLEMAPLADAMMISATSQHVMSVLLDTSASPLEILPHALSVLLIVVLVGTVEMTTLHLPVTVSVTLVSKEPLVVIVKATTMDSTALSALMIVERMRLILVVPAMTDARVMEPVTATPTLEIITLDPLVMSVRPTTTVPHVFCVLTAMAVALVLMALPLMVSASVLATMMVMSVRPVSLITMAPLAFLALLTATPMELVISVSLVLTRVFAMMDGMKPLTVLSVKTNVSVELVPVLV